MIQKEVERAERYEDLVPLLELCRAGKLFDVQNWIIAAKPVNPPRVGDRKSRKQAPLAIAIDLGFHSMVQVLLEAGADVSPSSGYCPMSQALNQKRLDIIRLLVKHGYDPKEVDVRDVLTTWKPQIIEFFIDQGIDIETDNPLAWALCNRIRTALGVVKKYRGQISNFQSQIDVALRYHCKEGNLKWVLLMLWAGADPYSPGQIDPYAEATSVGGLSALGYAALYKNYEILELKQLNLLPDHPCICEVAQFCRTDRAIQILEKLLKKGWNPNDQENGGCSIIQLHLLHLDFSASFHSRIWGNGSVTGDSQEARELMKAIHLLVKYGARWRPKDTNQINSARRSLLKVSPDYTVELIWIMAKYGACFRDDAKALLRTPTIKRHTFRHAKRLADLIIELKVNE